MYIAIASALALATIVVAVAFTPEAGAVVAGLTVFWVARGRTGDKVEDLEPSPELRRLVRDARGAHEIASPSWDFYYDAGQRLPG
jgi:hypothetical protein